jgi:uncharacterized protein (TIGR00156 family)
MPVLKAREPFQRWKQYSNLHDDRNVILEGYLIKKIKEEHYLFKDDTGEIEIEIDDEDFRGQQVTPKNQDKDHRRSRQR